MHNHTSEILNSTHYRIIAITTLCASVAFFDFSLFIYLTDLFSVVFFGSNPDSWLFALQVFALFATGYLARPFGGLLLGKFGDTYGRQSALSLSILGTMIFTLIIACLPTYHYIGILAPLLLVVARFGQGLAIGGSLPAAWSLISEHLPSKNIGLGCGFVCAGCIVSFLMAMSLLNFLQNSLTFTEMLGYGWRILFIIGGLGCLLAFFLLKSVAETPIFASVANPNASLDSYVDGISLEEQSNPTPAYAPATSDSFRPEGLRTSLKTIFKYHRFALIAAMLISLIITSLSLFIPTLLVPLLKSNFLIAKEDLYFGTVIGLIFLVVGSVLFGYLVDRFDAGRVLVLGGAFLITEVLVSFYHLQQGGEFILVFFALLGLANGLIGALPSVMTRLFPTKVRMTGLGLSYNLVNAVVGGILPFVLGYVSFYYATAPAIYLALIGLFSIFISFFVYYMPRSERDLSR